MFNEGDLVEFIPASEFNGFDRLKQEQTIDQHGPGPFTVIQSLVPNTSLLGVYNGERIIRLFRYRFRLVNPVVTIKSLEELM